MTNFETEVYSRSGEDVIGARVVVSANNGQQIDSIQVTNKTQFDELKAKLDVLDSSYVQFDDNSSLAGESIDSLLTNSEEEFLINATKLGGLQSDQYSKVGHTHNKASISDLYNYDISVSNPNVNVNETVTLTVKVTKQDGNPVPYHSFSILRNGTLWKNNVATNNQGVYSVIYTPDTAGMVTFSVLNQKTQLNVNSILESVTLTNADMVSGRFTSSAKIYFQKRGKLVIMDYYLPLNVAVDKDQELQVAMVPTGFLPNSTNYQNTWVNGPQNAGRLYFKTATDSTAIKFYIWNGSSNTKPIMRGQIVYWIE